MSFQPPSSLTLAGHLELLKVSKSRVPIRRKRHRYWFLFDERNCQLRYYANEVDLKTSQGCIDMTSCRISLSLENSEIGQRTVILSQKVAEYHLLASSPQEAQRWYVGLQDKKEQSRKAKRASLVVHPSVVIPNKKQDRTCYSAGNLSDTSPYDIQSPASKSPMSLSPRHGSDLSNNGNWNGSDSPMFIRSHSYDDMSGQQVEVPPRRPASTDLVEIVENVDFPNATSPPVLPPKSPTILLEMAELPPEEVIREEPPNLPPRDTHTVLNQLPTKNPEVQSKMSHLELQVNVLKRDMDLRNKQLEEQQSLNEELRKIVDRLLDTDPDNKRNARRLVSEIQELQTRVQHLESVNKTLNLQLMKAQEKEEDFEQGEVAEEIRYKALERNFLLLKANHVKCLARMLSVPSGTSFTSGPDVVSREEELVRSEIIKMLQSDCPPEEVCQIFNADKLLDFQDECGDTYYAENETLAYAYLTRRLYLRYTQHEQAEIREKWKDFLKNVKVSPRGYLELWDKKKELKCNILMGLPLSCGDMRVQLWTSLITRWIDDVRTKQDDQHGGCYYTCLLEKSQREESIHEKQISLDLERTLPSNLLFKPETEAIYKMYNVLMAFVHHAPETGYTQGMNQLVALSLFFLDEKMAFWCLVAIVQKILPNDYYSHGLIGAQADQAVLLEVIAEKMPDLAAHFSKVDNINVTWVTLNWFITLFVDALPTEPIIRLWDFVLLEGRIVLFKFSLGLLRMYKSQILKITDSVTLLQFLKGMTRQTFNVEEMCKEAYETKINQGMLKRFEYHYLRIKAEHVKMEKEKDELLKAEHERLKQKKLKAIAAATKLLSYDQSVTPPGTPTDTPTDMLTAPISHRHFTVVQYLTENPQQNAKPRWICSCPCRKNEVWLVFQIGKRPNLVISVTVSPVIKMDHIEIRIPRDPMCMYYNPVCSAVLVGTLDFRLLAFDIADHKQLWIFKLNDSILCITSWKNSTFVGLADGSVATFENLDREVPQPPRMVKLGFNAILAMLVTSTDQLWCAVGNSIITLDLKTLEQNDSTGTDDDQQRNVNSLSESSHGVWGSYRSSTLITLFDITTLVKLLNIDYKMVVIGREVPDTSDQTMHDLRITGFLVNDNILWVGTGGGSVLTFEIQKSTEDDGERTKERRHKRLTLRSRRSVALTSSPGLLVSSGKESEVHDLEASVQSESVIPSRSPLLPSRMRFATMQRRSKPVELQDIQSAYQLKFITGQSVARTTDHVRKFIAFNDEKFTYIMSCVRATHDESNPIQIWNCRGSDPLKWSFRNLDYVSFVQSPDLEESH